MIRKKSQGGKKFSPKKDGYGKKSTGVKKEFPAKRKYSGKKEFSSKDDFIDKKDFSDRSFQKEYYGKKESRGVRKFSDRPDKSFKKESHGKKENSGAKKYYDKFNKSDKSFKKESYGKKENTGTKKYSDSSDKQGFYSRKENKSSKEYSERKDRYAKKEFRDTKDSSGKKYYKEKSDFYGRKDYRSRNELSDKKRYAKKKKIAPILKDPDSTEVYVKKEGEEGLMRLNKFIAANGIASRRKVDEMIEQGRVTVNKKTVTELGFKIDTENDKVKVDGELVKTDTKKVYIIMNKPKGVITSVSDEKKRTTVIDLINLNQKIYPVGRLDFNTSGMLLLTNDGEFANHLMSPKNKVHKTYYVQLSKPLEEKHRIKLSEGIKLDGIRTAPAKIKFLKNNDYTRLYISIYEGRNRQIHNMFEHYGYFVRELIRVEYGGLKMEGLAEGSWRYLTAVEIAKLK